MAGWLRLPADEIPKRGLINEHRYQIFPPVQDKPPPPLGTCHRDGED